MPALSDSIQFLKGVGPSRAEEFSRLGVNCVEDLLFTFPRKISDRRNIVSIDQAMDLLGEEVVIRAEAIESKKTRVKFRTIATVVFTDDTGIIEGVWFNSAWVLDKFDGRECLIFGKPAYKRGRLQIMHPRVEFVNVDENESDTLGKLIPVYPLTGKLTQNAWLKVIRYALQEYGHLIEEFYPPEFLEKRQIMSRREAIQNMHFPENVQARNMAKERLVYDECLILQLGIAYRRHSQVDVFPGRSFKIDDTIDRRIRRLLPFKFTEAQEKALSGIVEDMKSSNPMHRLLQGDVGSGKTAVAFYAALAAVANRAQTALMAPTELLARQHFATFEKFLSNSGRSRVRVGLLVGGMSAPERRALLTGIQAGTVDIVIGTHAAIQKDVNFRDLGLVIIDEQHKFGVEQRALLRDKGNLPDVLVMTATPIPRSLALTLYGDLDVSTIDGMPPGRKRVKTHLPRPEEWPKVWDFLRKQLTSGRQAYIVSPLVEENEDLNLRSAEEAYESLSEGELKGFRLGLLHGKMKRDQQLEVMTKFREGAIDALVSTVVIEVGVDVPNATILTILHAERFGLSQLHQLRGRVSRGSHQGHCILLSDANNPLSRERLQILCKESDGFRISEEDLRIRGEGEFLGRRQHGHALKLASIIDDFEILRRARDDARRILKSDPNLQKESHQAILRAMVRQLGDSLHIAGTG